MKGGTLPGHNIGTFSIVPLIVDSVKIPVMAAGGIADRRTFNASFALGAEGVFCGTLFLSATEARTAPNVKEMILKAMQQIWISLEPFHIIIDQYQLHFLKSLLKWIKN